VEQMKRKLKMLLKEVLVFPLSIDGQEKLKSMISDRSDMANTMNKKELKCFILLKRIK